MVEKSKIVIPNYKQIKLRRTYRPSLMMEIIFKRPRPLIDDVKRNIKTDSMGRFNFFKTDLYQVLP